MPSAAPISSAWPEPGRSGADDLLQRDDVRVDLAQHLGDARRHDAPIHAAAAVDVVGRDADVDARAPRFGLLGHCCRSRIQTNGPTIFSHSGRARQRVERDLVAVREIALVVGEQPRGHVAIAHRDVDFVVVLERSVVHVRRAEHRPDAVDDQDLGVHHRAAVFEDADAGLEQRPPHAAAGEPHPALVGAPARAR